MEITLILKMLGIGLCVAIATQMLSKCGRDEQAVYVSIAGIITALLILVGEISALFDTISGVFGL